MGKKDKDKPRAFNSTLPAPSKPMARGKGLPRENKTRKQKRIDDELVYGPQHHYIRKHERCLLERDARHQCRGRVSGHHIKHVNGGGIDANNEIALCAWAHMLDSKSIHTMGKQSFAAYWNVDVLNEAIALTTRFELHRNTAK